MIGNLLKAAVSVVVSPVAAVVDLVTLPGSAFDGKDAFHRTAALLDNAGKCVQKAIEPEDK